MAVFHASNEPPVDPSRVRHGDALQRAAQGFQAVRQIGGQQLPRLGRESQKLGQGSWVHQGPPWVHRSMAMTQEPMKIGGTLPYINEAYF